MTRWILLLSVVLLPCASKAGFAQEAPAHSWEGFRVGIFGELGRQGDDDVVLNSDLGGPLPSFGRAFANGGALGVSAGRDWQFGDVLVGFDASISAGGSFSEARLSGGIVNINTNLERRIGATFGPRIGYIIGGSAIYATAGLDIANLSYSLDARDPDLAAYFREDRVSLGGTVGLGIDTRITDNWSLDLGYRYMAHGSKTLTVPVVDLAGIPTGELLATKVKYEGHMVRFGLTRRF